MGCDETLRLWDEHGQGRKRVVSNDRRALFLSNVGGSIDGELVDHNEEFTADVIGEESEIQQTARQTTTRGSLTPSPLDDTIKELKSFSERLLSLKFSPDPWTLSHIIAQTTPLIRYQDCLCAAVYV